MSIHDNIKLKLVMPQKRGHRGADLQGKFSHLLVKRFAGIYKRRSYWECLCDCGEIAYVCTTSLRSGSTKSCGCVSMSLLMTRNLVHGKSGSPEYHAYTNAKGRCRNRQHPKYSTYGQRGIRFNFDSFEAFFNEVGQRPTEYHSLDRIDVNGHYEPGNLRWATATEQSRNTRKSRLITMRGITKHIAEWAKDAPVQHTTILARLNHGWCGHCAITVELRGGCDHRVVQPETAIKTAKRSVTAV